MALAQLRSFARFGGRIICLVPLLIDENVLGS